MLGNLLLVWISPFASRLASHVSSILTYEKPCAASPVLTIASAAARTLASSTAPAHTFQLFHPSAGVWASLCMPATILSLRLASPRGPRTVMSTTVSPLFQSEPVMMPVLLSRVSPLGRLRAEKESGP